MNIKILSQQGMSQRAIAKQLGVSRKTPSKDT
jgi:transposase